ncbi:hypothetical protein JW890_05860 [candidate division WOR-3 bacterium]|nr:hypothetical protein [candidate division WOR-3 bacterium]
MILLFTIFINIFVAQNDIPVTRWAGDGFPITYREWASSYSVRDDFFSVKVFQRHFPETDLVQIIVESEIYPGIIPEVCVLVSDLVSEGYSVSVETVPSVQTSQACTALRNNLASKLPLGLVGAYFIGDVPVAWFQMIDDWGSGPEGYEEFPCDLFYMDLDGTWNDDSIWINPNLYLSPGQDGIFDAHAGDVSPEIWVGRLFLSSLGDEDSLAPNYLRRVHRYKTDSFQSVCRGLSYVDDDWAYWANIYSSNMQAAYQDVVSVSQIDTTNPVNYKKHLGETYEWVGIFCHSSPALHSFKVNSGTGWSDMYASEIPQLRPLGLFYNLFACSNARFVETNFMGGLYVIKTPFGIGAVGSTKTGSMLEFQHFYTPLGQGANLGEAFLQWFQAIAVGGFENWEKSWFYGMSLYGDPTVKLSPAGPFLEIASFQVTDSLGNSDGRIDPGEEAVISFTVFNHPDAQDASLVDATLLSLDGSLSVTFANSFCPSIPAGDTVWGALSFSLSASPSFQPHSALLVLSMNDGATGRISRDSLFLFIGRSNILVIDDDGGTSAEAACIQSLENLGYNCEVFAQDSFPLPNNFLGFYEMVIWLTGSSSAGTLTPEDQVLIENYFNSSGKIFLQGQNIAEELSGSSFLSSFLGVTWQGNTSVHFQTGRASDPVGDALVLATNLTSQDMLSVVSGVSECFRYQTNPEMASMIRKESPGKIVFAGFGLEGVVSNIPAYAPRDTLLSRILNYMEVSVNVEERTLLTDSSSVFSVFQTTGGALFRVPSGIAGRISIIIYDVSGRRVFSVYEGLSSRREYFWNFTDTTGEKISRGSYFALLISDQGESTIKFTVIR